MPLRLSSGVLALALAAAFAQWLAAAVVDPEWSYTLAGHLGMESWLAKEQPARGPATP